MSVSERLKKTFRFIIDKLNSLEGVDFEKLIVRVLTAWAVVGVLQNLVVGKLRFTDTAFFERYNIIVSVFMFATVFLIMGLPAFSRASKPLLWASFFILFLRTLWQRNEFGYYLGAVLIMTLVTAYTLKGVAFKKDIRTSVMWVAILPFAALVTTLLCVVTVLLYKAYWTPNFDFGIFSQMFYYMKETLIPYTTCERDRLLSHFAVHFSPIFYLLLPFYFVFPSPITLLVLQALISVSGIFPLVLIAKKYNHSNLTSFFLAICYLGIPAITGGNLYYLHENVFLSPLLLWLFYFVEKKSSLPAFVFAFLVMLVKEDAPIYIIIFGIYLIVSKRNTRLGLGLSGVALAYFALVLGLLDAFGEGAMVGRFENFNKSGEPISLTGVVLTAFSNPAYLISECFENNRILFLLQLFVPLMFLPFFTRKYSRLILLVPVVLVNLLSDYAYQHDMNYQYVFGPLAFVIYLTVMNAADMGRVRRTKILLLAATASVMVFYSMYYGRFSVVRDYKSNMAEHRAIYNALETVPDDASVSASTFLVAALSEREVIYELESTKNITEYYVLDLRYKNDKYPLEYFTEGDYETVCLNNYVGVFRAK